MAANDHAGSSACVMSRTRAPSQEGSAYGSLLVISCWMLGSSTGLPSSGPVTESNGLRDRIGPACIAWSVLGVVPNDAGRVEWLAGAGGASIAPLEATS